MVTMAVILLPFTAIPAPLSLACSLSGHFFLTFLFALECAFLACICKLVVSLGLCLSASSLSSAARTCISVL